MFCARHTDRIAIGACIKCAQGVCDDCQITVKGQLFCVKCAPAPEPVIPTTSYRNPLLAAMLSLVPGVGQVFNGEASKGIVIFLTSWLIIPWIYGIYDAYQTALRINRKEIVPLSTSSSAARFLVIMLMVLAGPVIIYQAVKHYLYLSKIDLHANTARQMVLDLAQAVEKYKEDHGHYPQDYGDLHFAEPPYVNEMSCDVALSGYHISCVFDENGYALTAKPINPADPMKTSFTVVTGGILQE
jgi:Tfp pilus assembly protein PilE